MPGNNFPDVLLIFEATNDKLTIEDRCGNYSNQTIKFKYYFNLVFFELQLFVVFKWNL